MDLSLKDIGVRILSLHIVSKQFLRDRGVEIKLIWILNHTEISGNEQADRLAREVVSGRDTQLGIPV
ncbi:hypothetical protein ALC53_05871 [Atta colombica]|uniref:RNase H type-1 domain-containing protein n=1 Tax=Atta colombica TaxID=520822 RepID=A0A151I3J2_9HYME|nr:hypothetical protein ALC53_05871 [Atta colombica]